jgi:hypothetical protein
MNLFKQANIPQGNNVNKINYESFQGSKLKRILLNFGYKNWKDFYKKIENYNHRIIKIEYLEETMDVGTITVDGKERWHNYHTFAIESGIFVKNSIMEDYFFAQSSEGRGSKVDTLPAGENLGQIDDLKYFNNKLMRGLRVPPSYVPSGPDDGTQSYSDGRVGTAYMQELRFANYCSRLQRNIEHVFDEEFKVFMKLRGIEIESSVFELKFNPPENFAKYRQIELDSAQLALIANLFDVPFISKRFVMERYMNLSEEELLKNERYWKQENEKKLKAKSGAVGASGSSEGLGSVGVSSSGGGGDLGGAPSEPDLNTSAEEGDIGNPPETAGSGGAGGGAPAQAGPPDVTGPQGGGPGGI